MSRKYLEIIGNKDLSFEQKLQQLADEAIEAAKMPIDLDMPIWYRAVVLFEFSLGFLNMSYQIPEDMRKVIMETFKTQVIKTLN